MSLSLEYVKCNTCGSGQSTTHLERGDLNLFLPGTFTLVECSACGLVYQNPRPAISDYSVLYSDEYDQFTGIEKNNPATLSQKIRQYGLTKRIKFLEKYGKSGRLLDIGCATGDFLKACQATGRFHVSGIEPSSFASELCKNLGLDVKTGFLEDGDYPDRTFDVVTLWNVIEHLPDPNQSLRLINRILNNDGILVITTPNLDSLEARLFKDYWIGYELPRHYFVYSENSLTRLLTSAGFVIREKKCLYGSHAAFMSSLRFWFRHLHPSKSNLSVFDRVLFSLPLRILLAPAFFLTDRLRVSSSLTYLCTKLSSAA